MNKQGKQKDPHRPRQQFGGYQRDGEVVQSQGGSNIW